MVSLLLPLLEANDPRLLGKGEDVDSLLPCLLDADDLPPLGTGEGLKPRDPHGLPDRLLPADGGSGGNCNMVAQVTCRIRSSLD